jgi:hypothetical protein
MLCHLLHHGACCLFYVAQALHHSLHDFAFSTIFLQFLHHQKWCLLRYLAYLTIADGRENSNILSLDIEVGGAILNSPFRPRNGHFTNNISTFFLSQILSFFTLQQQHHKLTATEPHCQAH